MLFKSLKYYIVGGLFMLVGWLIGASNAGFVLRSESVQLTVTHVETRIESEGKRMYRPTFTLVTDQRPRPEHTGGQWSSPPHHELGDVVPGRYHAETGRMRSDKMLNRNILIGAFLWLLGFFAFLQGILIMKGVPEEILPLRVSGSRSRRRAIFSFK